MLHQTESRENTDPGFFCKETDSAPTKDKLLTFYIIYVYVYNMYSLK